MPIKFNKLVHEPNLLKLLILIHDWENDQLPELRTLTGRNLYFRIAASLISDKQSPQHLKPLKGMLTERATRQRIRIFQHLGLLQILNNESDQRTKRAMPTEKFLQHLNQHIDAVRQLCDSHYFIVDKNN